jgi:hypothetical protein
VSSLFLVQIAKVDGPNVTMDVTPIHPDAGTPPTDASFALTLLVDLWIKLEAGWSSRWLTQAPALEPEEAKRIAALEPWGPVFGHLRDLRDGIEVAVSREEYEATRVEGATWRGRRVVGRRSEAKLRSDGSSEHDRAAIGRQLEALAGSGEASAIDELLALRRQLRARTHEETFWLTTTAIDAEASFRGRARELVTSVEAARAGDGVTLIVTVRDPELLRFLPSGVIQFETASYS